jgi:hypothetical protein
MSSSLWHGVDKAENERNPPMVFSMIGVLAVALVLVVYIGKGEDHE